MVDEAFGWASLWRRVVYKIETVDGIECIVSNGREKVTYYNPLEIENLSKRPKSPKANLDSPEIALARLDLNNRKEIINYANQFGLLGLWFHPDYCLAKELDDIGDSCSINGTRFSNWYRHPRKKDIYAWMEPLEMFVRAARDYQRFLDNITTVEKNDDQEGAASFPVNFFWKMQLRNVHIATVWDGKDWTLGWEYQSLLSALYLKLLLNKQAGKLIRRCRKRRCGKFFIADHLENGFCSDNCKFAYYKANSINRGDKEELIKKYNSIVDSQTLASFIDSILERGISGKGRIEKRIINELINKSHQA
jgi:hypothetical protein